MKKDSLRNVPYPVYPPYQGMGPMMPGGMAGGPGGMMPTMPYMSQGMSNQPGSCSANSNDVSSIKSEIENLKKRVSYLENNLLSNSNYSSNYNSSNYQVM